LLERLRHRAGEAARAEHGAAERHEDQGERRGVVLGRLQAKVQQRLLDEHFPAGRLYRRRRDETAALRRIAGLAPIPEDSASGAAAPANQIVAREALERGIAGMSAGVDHAIALIDDRDARVGQRAKVLDEELELREIERAADELP